MKKREKYWVLHKKKEKNTGFYMKKREKYWVLHEKKRKILGLT